MNSRTTNRFWKCYGDLPESIKEQARKAFRIFMEDPYYPSLQFKRIHANRPVFSLRITRSYRAIGIQQGEDLIWFWIGGHSEYEKMIKNQKS